MRIAFKALGIRLLVSWISLYSLRLARRMVFCSSVSPGGAMSYGPGAEGFRPPLVFFFVIGVANCYAPYSSLSCLLGSCNIISVTSMSR